MSVSRGNHRCPSPDIGVSPTRSLLPILPRLYGYPRGTSTAYAYIEFIAPVGAASSEQLQQHRARVAPIMPSRRDANLAAAGRLPCLARRAGRLPARSAARCRRSRSWRIARPAHGGLCPALTPRRACRRFVPLERRTAVSRALNRALCRRRSRTRAWTERCARGCDGGGGTVALNGAGAFADRCGFAGR
jgi:hypothetical protein